MIQKFIIHGSQMEYGKHLDNLYNCHNILFKHDIMYYPTSYAIPKSEVIKQEFTIHHFIYYLIHGAVTIHKRRSRRFTEWEVYELIEDNMYKAHDFYLNQLYNKFKMYNLYKYLYLINSENIISFILDINNLHYNLMPTDTIDFDFINLTEEDLIYYNEKLLYSYFADDIDVIKSICNNNLKCADNKKTSNNGIGLVDFYKQTIAKERLQHYEAELIEKTWHPSRLIDWCFDNEEKNDIGVITH